MGFQMLSKPYRNQRFVPAARRSAKASQKRAIDAGLLNAALAYAAMGWRIFPVHGIVDGRCTCGKSCGRQGKHPCIKRRPLQATTDVNVIRTWWAKWPNANPGL